MRDESGIQMEQPVLTFEQVTGKSGGLPEISLCCKILLFPWKLGIFMV